MRGLALWALVGMGLSLQIWPPPPPPAFDPTGCAARTQAVQPFGGALLFCAEGGRWPDGQRLGDPTAPGCRMAGPALRLLGLPVDVNRANVEDLEALPGIGPKMAERIAAARPFRRPSDLAGVPGIGPKRLAELQSAVTVTFAAAKAQVGPDGRRMCADHL